MASESIKKAAVNEASKGNLPQKFQYKKKSVVIAECNEYTREALINALKTIINLLDIKKYFQDKEILLKPNYLAPSDYAYTEPTVIMAIQEILKKKGATRVMVGDSTMTKGLTSLTLKRTCISEKCAEEQIELKNFFESNRKKVTLKNPQPGVEKDIFLPEEAVDADLVINLPKLKTHNGYVYTGAIKNLFGLLGNKMKMHMKYKNKQNFQKLLGDIYFALEESHDNARPKVLTIMDAVIAMEGKGPRAGDPRKVGVLIAGFNPAAVDMVGFSLMNGDPRELTAIKSVAQRTELPVSVNDLDIKGVSNYESLVISDFEKPRLQVLKEKQVSGLFSKIADKMTSISIKIDRGSCTLCGQCVAHCPAEAMVKRKNKIVIDQDSCVECFCCGESCPNDAISAKFYLFRIMPYFILLVAGLGIAIGFGIWFLLS
ncbi:MAG: DUF362 domain-containing protein [Promethearchaeia archaeon]